jgi:hypothetical protein
LPTDLRKSANGGAEKSSARWDSISMSLKALL